MRRKKIYIVNKNSRAAAYGIGTYMAQLIDCLKRTNIEFGVINLHAQVKEVSIEQKEGYTLIFAPFVDTGVDATRAGYYSRNVAYILRDLIPPEPDYDIVFHLNFMTDATLVNYLKKLFKCKVVLTIHYTNWSFALLGDDKKLEDVMSKKKRDCNESERRIRKDFEEDIKMANKCDRIAYIAQHSADMLSKYLKNKDKLIINNGLKDTYKGLSEEKRHSIKEKQFINKESRIVLFAGRLDEVKGVNYLIRSFRNVLCKFPDAILMIVGDGDYTSLLRDADGIWSKVVFTGKLEKKKLYELYRIADIGVVSSVHEEFGYVAIEMMMHRLPVIASDTGGLAEIIEDGVSGLKVPVITRQGKRSVNVNRLALQIGSLLEDEALAAEIGKGGRQRFMEKYELSVFREKILNLYDNI